MANDKRHPMSTDLNDINPNDASVMTDRERAALQMPDSDQINKPKKAM